MPLVLFFLLLVFFFPWLILPLAAFFLLNLLLLPFGFTLRSLWNFFTVPGELMRIALNRNLRKNHALEHATINVLEERFGPQRLSGNAAENGFYIHGAADPRLIEEAARIGYSRLLAGERHLAIHKRCGTTIAAANFVASAVFLALLLGSGHFTLLNVVVALAIANLTGPALGSLLQAYVTTDADVRDRVITGVEYSFNRPAFVPWGWQVLPTEFFVRTRVIR
ncbi:MAG: hypothetical protein PWP12_216 [Bacillota bacterium]|nr:hypothetical protein [Bacillota bacterium]MDK2882007.1 hypothetical protein [Bacillota bacterium]MDK2960032.1 hypothetical protein [Bacillota bacterium]